MPRIVRYEHMCVKRLIALVGFVLQIFVLLNKLSVGNEGRCDSMEVQQFALFRRQTGQPRPR